MTRSQFARAVRADEKWVENTSRILGRRLSYSVEEARWLGLVRLLAHEIGMPLARAARAADEALRHPPESASVRVLESAEGVAAVAVDLARYHSTFAAALSAALHHDILRRRGRPAAVGSRRDPLAAAAAHGIDLPLLRASMRETPATRLRRLDENVAFLKAVRAARRRAR